MEREIKTVMHEVKRRTLQVVRTENVTDHIKRITLGGEDLRDFVTLSPDDHVKIFFPTTGQEQVMRDYTPKRFDARTLELDLEFFLHGEGPGSQWAQQAKPGQFLTVGGPRGSKIVPYTFDWYLMIGDEPAMPSFSRRLLELPVNSKAVVIVETEDESQKIDFAHKGSVQIHWIYRNGSASGSAEAIKKELNRLSFPQGDYFAWLALEKSCAREIREFLLLTKGASEEWMKATGYWQQTPKEEK